MSDEEWRDPADAPRDGTRILILDKYDEQMTVAWARGSQLWSTKRGWGLTDLEVIGWRPLPESDGAEVAS